MSPPVLRIPVGVVVERRKSASPWADTIWQPVAVLTGVPEAAAWTVLSEGADAATFYAGPAEIALYRSEAENYRRNLASGAPSIWIALHPTGREPPYQVAVVTADPAEGEALTEPGQAIIEAVPMPDAIRDIIAEFVEQCPAEPAFVKRKRDRTDPEALARRGPRVGTHHGRR